MSDIKICAHGPDCAERFRNKYPNYSFTTVGYGYPPKELIEQYFTLVDIDYDYCFRGKEETHYCKECNEKVYNRIHH